MGVENQFQQYRQGQEIAPGYTLVQLLGSGMEGEVWRARASGGTSVAVKIVRSLSRVGGRKQLKALRTLRDIHHVHLCPLHCFWTKDARGRLLEEGEFDAVAPDSSVGDSFTAEAFMQTMTLPVTPEEDLNRTIDVPLGDDRASDDSAEAEQLILVMGLGEGTLHDRLVQVRAQAGLVTNNEADAKVPCGLSAEETIHYLRGAADAIDTLNRDFNLFHCDIKPQNILVVGGGAQVCDFGLANKVTGDLTKTQAMMFATLAYAAPEVLRKKYSRSVDQYSLATTYFELRTGLLPFDITTEADVTFAKCAGRLDFSKVSKAERKVLKRAMSVDPTARYDSCTDFVDAIAQASGLQTRPFPVRVMLVAAMLMAVLTGYAVWEFRPAADGISASRTFEDAIAERDKSTGFTPGTPEDYRWQLDPLRDSIDTASQALDHTRDSELISRIREFLTKTSFEFARLIDNQLAAGGFGNVEDNADIRSDLELLENMARNGQAIEDSESLQLQVRISQSQLALLSDETVSPECLEALRRTVAADPKVLPATLLALAHASSDPSGKYTIQNPDSLREIAVAKKMIDGQSRQSLPKWCLRKWDSLTIELIPVLELATNDKSTDRSIRAIIEQGWPDILGDAELNSLKAAIAQQRFDNFQTDAAEFIKRQSNSRSESLRSKTDVLKLLRKGLDEPAATAVVFQQLAGKFDNDSALQSYFRSAIPTWVGEIARRAENARPTIDDVQSIHRLGVNLIDSEELTSSTLNSLFLTTAIDHGPPFKQLDRTIKKISADDQSKANQFRSLAMIIESAAISQPAERLGRYGEVDRVRQLLLDSDPMANIRSSVPPFYVIFIEGVSAWHTGDIDGQRQAWNQLHSGSDANNCRTLLGPARCQWIASTLIAAAKQESGVRDDEVLRRRYLPDLDPDRQQPGDAKQVSDESKWVFEARWWIENVPATSPIVQSVVAEEFLIDAAKSELKSLTPPVQLRDRLLATTPDDGDGQLYRAAYEMSLAKNLDSWALKYAVACLNIGLGEGQIESPGWITELLEPTMAMIRQKPSILWSLDPTTMEQFTRHYLKTKDSRFSLAAFSDAAESDWLRGNELSAEFLAKTEADSEKKVSLLLVAAECLQRQVGIENGGWDAKSLKQLRRYVFQAIEIAPNNPEVAVTEASLNFYEADASNDVLHKTQRLRSAVKSLERAVEGLKETDRGEALYNARYRLANSLVVLAKYERRDRKQSLLEKARNQSLDAVRMVSPNSDRLNVKENAAFINLGNSCEDLAYYCSSKDSEKQNDYYREAIEAFEKAANRALMGGTMKERFYLARCRYRSFGTQKTPQNLNQAFADLGQFQESATKRVQFEWLGWRAKIQKDLGKIEKAIDDCKLVYAMIVNQEISLSNDDEGEFVNLYVECLNANCALGGPCDSDFSLKLLDDVLEKATGELYWKLVLRRCESLKFSGDTERVLPTLEMVPADHYAALEIEPISVSETLVRLMIYLHNAETLSALDVTGDHVKSPRARQCGDQLLQRMTQYQAELNKYPAAELHLRFVDALVQSLSDRPVQTRVKAFTDVLPTEKMDDVDDEVLTLMRLALYQQCDRVLRAVNLPNKTQVNQDMVKGLQENGSVEAFKEQMKELLFGHHPLTPKHRYDIGYMRANF